MKNILFASTALVASAGIASADIALSGWAEIGVFGGETLTDSTAGAGDAGTKVETDFHTDIDVTFSMTGETDNGLTFGATVDLDENGAFGASTQGGETYFVAFGNFRLDMGDTDGAFDAAMREVNVVGGSINDAETSHAGFNGNAGLDSLYGGQVARFTYTASGFTGYASVQLPGSTNAAATDNAKAVYGVGVRYTTDLGGTALGVGAGYQSTSDSVAAVGTTTKDQIWGVSVDATMTNGITGAVNYSVRKTGAVETKHTAIGVGYTMNNIGLGLNWGQSEVTGAAAKDSGFGLAATYDLGGGMVAQFGYGKNTDSTSTAGAVADSAALWSLGLAMSF